MVKTSFEVTVNDAVMEGPSGEARLVAMLDSLNGFKKITAVAALGDASGDQGPGALCALLAARPRSVDLRCAALLALAKREGATASDVLATHLAGVPAAVRDYAIIGLAAIGDDRAWDEVHTILQRQLDRPQPSSQPQRLMAGLQQFQALVAVAYLVRHLAASPEVRIPKLGDILRARFDRLYAVEQDWLRSHWPAIAPQIPDNDQIDAPDPEPFLAWVYTSHLFDPTF